MGRSTNGTDENNAFSINPAQDRDWEWMNQGSIEGVWNTLSPEQKAGTNREHVMECLNRQVKKFQGPDAPSNIVLVARNQSGKRAGFVWVSIIPNYFADTEEAVVLMIFVADTERRKGLGDLLMEAAEEWARKSGMTRICLNVGVHNIPALQLYERVGYRHDTIRQSKRI